MTAENGGGRDEGDDNLTSREMTWLSNLSSAAANRSNLGS
jgi:hypothetical protein